MTLADNFTAFRARLPEGMDRNQSLFAQACYLAGSQAVFQILANTSDLTAEEAFIVWGSVQKEIQDAIAAPSAVKREPSSIIIRPN